MLSHLKQQNQPERECLYAWYPEVSIPNENTNRLNPRDIYLQNGLDKDLLGEKSTTTTNARKLTKYKSNERRKKTKKKKIPSICHLFNLSCFFVVVTSAHNNNRNTNVELLQRYKQSVASSERAYHSTETIDEALNPPWALHYQIQRRAATPNLPLESTESK